MQEGDEEMTAEQVCEELKISPATLNRRVQKGLIRPKDERNPNLQRPKKYTFLRSEIERYKKGLQNQA